MNHQASAKMDGEQGLSIQDLADNPSHLGEVANLHVKRIYSPQSFLGTDYMFETYQGILENDLGKIFIASMGNKLAGFISLIQNIKSLKKRQVSTLFSFNLVRIVFLHPVFLLDILGHIFCESALDNIHCLYMASFAVESSPDARKASRELIRTAKEHATLEGKGISLLTRKANKKGLAFYQRHGFQLKKKFLNICCLAWFPETLHARLS